MSKQEEDSGVAAGCAVIALFVVVLAAGAARAYGGAANDGSNSMYPPDAATSVESETPLAAAQSSATAVTPIDELASGLDAMRRARAELVDESCALSASIDQDEEVVAALTERSRSSAARYAALAALRRSRERLNVAPDELEVLDTQLRDMATRIEEQKQHVTSVERLLEARRLRLHRLSLATNAADWAITEAERDLEFWRTASSVSSTGDDKARQHVVEASTKLKLAISKTQDALSTTLEDDIARETKTEAMDARWKAAARGR